jgi:drug/metabolite transporter (DMT)-like permease
MDRSSNLINLSLVLWFTVSFALTNSMAGMAYAGGADPLTVATARFIVPTLVLVLALWFTGSGLKLPMADALSAIGLGIITAGFSFAMLNAIEILGVSLAVLIFFLFPVFTSLIVAMMGWEKLSTTTIIAALIAFSGLALTLGVNGESLNILGIVCALIGALGLALVSSISSRVIRSGDSRKVTFYIVSSAATIFIIFSLIRFDLHLPTTNSGWTGIIGTSVFYACGIIGYFVAISKIGPAKATLYSYVEPLFTMLAAFLFLSELLLPLQIVGALIVVGALTISGIADLKKNKTT